MLTCGAVSVASMYHCQYLMLTCGAVSVARVYHCQDLMLTCGAVSVASVSLSVPDAKPVVLSLDSEHHCHSIST